MSQPNVLVNFRLDKERPLRLRWLATDGVPGDGYKAQVTAIKLRDGAVLAMDASAILEHTAADPAGGMGAYAMTFNGMVGYAADHPDRTLVDHLEDQEVDYDVTFIHDDGARTAIEGQDFKIIDRPRGSLHRL